MGLWQRLFSSKSQTRTDRKQGPALRRPTVAAEPKSPAPGSPEAWAEALKAKKDYSALAAVTHEAFSDQWWPKVRLAQKILTQAGAEAVPAILEEIGSRGRCESQLADVLVDIADPRAVPLLKQSLRKKEFTHVPGTQSNVERFVAKFDSGFEEEQRLAKAREEADAYARLTAPPPPGTQMREYATAYVFRPAAEARRAFDAVRSATRRGIRFPLDAPHQIALVHGPAADFVAILVRLPTPNDEGVALHRRLEAWFAETGVGSPDDYESLSAPLPGRLSRGLRYLAGGYTVLEMIDNL